MGPDFAPSSTVRKQRSPTPQIPGRGLVQQPHVITTTALSERGHLGRGWSWKAPGGKRGCAISKAKPTPYGDITR